VAPAATLKIAASGLNAVRRGFDHRLSMCPGEPGFLLGDGGLDFFFSEDEWDEDCLSASAFIGRQASQTVAAVNHLFDWKEQVLILSERLERSSRSSAGGPGPLKVESTKVSGDIDDLADEVEAGHSAGFHRFG
jgi:hypothetical protein